MRIGNNQVGLFVNKTLEWHMGGGGGGGTHFCALGFICASGRKLKDAMEKDFWFKSKKPLAFFHSGLNKNFSACLLVLEGDINCLASLH